MGEILRTVSVVGVTVTAASPTSSRASKTSSSKQSSSSDSILESATTASSTAVMSKTTTSATASATDSSKIDQVTSWFSKDSNRAIVAVCIIIGVIVAACLGIWAFIHLRKRLREKKKIESIEKWDQAYAARQDEVKAREETARVWKGAEEKEGEGRTYRQDSVYPNVPSYLPPGAAEPQRPGSTYVPYPLATTERMPSDALLPHGSQAYHPAVMEGGGQRQSDVLLPPGPQTLQRQQSGGRDRYNGVSYF